MTEPGTVIPPAPGWWVRSDTIGTNVSQFGWSSAASGPHAGLAATNGFGWAGSAHGIRIPELISAVVSELETSTATLNLRPATVRETVSETAHVTPALTAHRLIAAARAVTAAVTPSLHRITRTTLTRTITATVTATLVKPAAVAFDAVGAGNSGSVTTLSWSHTAASGAYVIVAAAWQGNHTISSVTYGGTAMSLLGSQGDNNSTANGSVAFYGLASPPTGSQTVTVNLSAITNVAANSVSYLNASSVGTVQAVFGTGNPMSQSVTDTSGQMIVQAFGEDGTTNFTSPTGGTNRYLNQMSGAKLSISDSTTSATFGVTGAASGTIPWAGLAVVLGH